MTTNVNQRETCLLNPDLYRVCLASAIYTHAATRKATFHGRKSVRNALNHICKPQLRIRMWLSISKDILCRQ
jgi:hypothetical protein